MGNGRNWLLQYIIYISSHKGEEYNCKDASYNKGKGKTCIYVAIKYTNCKWNHITNFLQYTSRPKIDINERKKKKKREKNRKKNSK